VVELAVNGMHCSSCASLIEETLARDPRVHRAAVDLEAGRASVVYDPGAITVDDLCAAVTEAGYVATPLPSTGPAS
jgi:Cu+-exporting ATPase